MTKPENKKKALVIAQKKAQGTVIDCEEKEFPIRMQMYCADCFYELYITDLISQT